LKNHQFVGRSAELDELKRKLLIDKDCQNIALVGLGGIGKTQVALQFANYVKQQYVDYSIFWVPALSLETFEQVYEEIASALGIRQSRESTKDVKKLVQHRLSGKSAGSWLMIVDNADDMDLLHGTEQSDGLLKFLPKSDDGLTVFTSRHFEIAQSVARGDIVELKKMEREEAIQLLKRSLGRIGPSEDDTAIADLVSELEYLPLAITQAAAYIGAKRSSPGKYLRLLKSTEENTVMVLSTEFRDNMRYENSAKLANAIAKTWAINFDQIRSHDIVAADLLVFISCIEWKAIPYSILPRLEPEARIEGAIRTLCSYSFLARREDENIYNMHRLVHLATRTWIRHKDREVETSRRALAQLLKVFPSDDYRNREIWRQYLPHVARIDKEEQFQESEEKSKLCLKVGLCLYVDGRIKEAFL
jgi:hypothetical protein